MKKNKYGNFKCFIKKNLDKCISQILWFFPRDKAHKILYYIHMKKRLNLDNPTTLNEKIQWMIVNYYGKKEGLLADKYLVKDYIRSLKIKDLNIPKTYFVFKGEHVNKDRFPEKFTLKTNHASGNVFVCKNKDKFDFEHAIKVLSKLLKRNFAKSFLEYHYSHIEPLIICEELLEDKCNELPLDYKFFCFNGEPDCVSVCSNRKTDLKIACFDRNWKHLNYTEKPSPCYETISKPKNLERMFEIAAEISKGFPFVRVDLYNIKGKIYFGEMTFTPGAGLCRYHTEDCQKYFGSKIDIEALRKNNK